MSRQMLTAQPARMMGVAAACLCLLLFMAVGSLAAAAAAAAPNSATPKLSSDLERCRAQANLDACYDAIRWSPSNPELLVALGDALVRANRSADAIRTYRRVAALAPNMPGVGEKIIATEAKLAGKRAPGDSGPHADTTAGKRYSNAAPETQSH
jgi:cytochrome c-type biogenesis protein CcmH/NrfG